MIIPSGLPGWERANDHSTYGGHLDKKSYQSQGVVDPRTDISPEQFVRMCEDLAAVMRVAPFASILLQADDDVPVDDPTVLSVRSMVGVANQSYPGDNPASNMPTVTRGGDGIVVISYPATLEDAYGVEGNIVFQACAPTVVNATADTNASYSLTGTSEVTVTVTDSGGAVISPLLNVRIWT